MKLKKTIILSVFVVALLLAGCAQGNDKPKSSIKQTFIMNTLVRVKVYGPKPDEVIEEAFDELDRIENLMSANITDSEVSTINDNAGLKPVKVGKDTFTVIKLAKEYAAKTDGLFDPSIGPLVDLWGIGTKQRKIPTKEEIKEVLTLVDYKKIILDHEKQTVYLAQKGMKIDVGGIAKGYAADLVKDIFNKHGIKSAFIDIGGNIMVHGQKPDDTDWKVGIQDPRSARNDLTAVFEVADQTVVTSGDYERYFEEDGIRYHHILNPKTGYPARTGLMSATAIGDSSFHADALSTSIYLLGREKGMELAQEMGYEAVVIIEDKKVYPTKGLEGNIQITNEEYSL